VANGTTRVNQSFLILVVHKKEMLACTEQEDSRLRGNDGLVGSFGYSSLMR
jgi:hypothetical protein